MNKSFEKLNSLKSERTTFNFTEEALDILERFSKNYEITQKETFSIMLDDDKLLSQVIKKLRNNEFDFSEKKIQKTKVISKGALGKLNELSKSESFSRDLILEIALRDINSQLTDRIESHKKAEEIIDEAIGKMSEVSTQLGELLEAEDPIIARWGLIEIVAENLSHAIHNELNKGIPIDPDDFSQSV
jgi:hypothetical protein